jgi:hypothetical protein
LAQGCGWRLRSKNWGWWAWELALKSTQNPIVVCNADATQSHIRQKQKKANLQRSQPLCYGVTDYRIIEEDFYKIVEFVEWFKEFYPEKASFLTKKS